MITEVNMKIDHKLNKVTFEKYGDDNHTKVMEVLDEEQQKKYEELLEEWSQRRRGGQGRN